MSVIKIEDIAYVRFAAPDLDAMKTFLAQFGLTQVPSADGVLYTRGSGPQPFLHATVAGEPGFKALGLRAESLADLKTLDRAALNQSRLAPFREQLEGWLVKHDADAVLVRPDRYVFGTGAAADLRRAWAQRMS